MAMRIKVMENNQEADEMVDRRWETVTGLERTQLIISLRKLRVQCYLDFGFGYLCCL